MRNKLSICTLLLFILAVSKFPVSAQFTNVLTFGGAGNENGHHLLDDGAGGFYVGGTFDAPFTPEDEPLPLYGQEDFFLGHLDATGNWDWIKSGGSFLNDELRVLRHLPNGELLMAGTFWLEFTYDDLKLTTSDNIKGIFVVRLNAAGEWQWAKVINGSDLKEINDIQIAPNGDIFLTGHFSKILLFDTLQLEAAGKNDAFLLQLSPEGNLLNWQQLGFKGTTRGQKIALHPDGGYYWGGVYDDTLRIDTTELYANTFDRDVFLIRCDPTGRALWARRAGGVFEEELSAMITDEAGNLLATGFLIGVMSLSESVSIQSRNGNADMFLFKYNDSGQVQWARAIGGNLIDQPNALVLLGQELVIGGTYQGQMSWDGFSTPANNGVNGFVAGFSPQDGAGHWLATITSPAFAFVEALSRQDEDHLNVLGSFSDSMTLGTFQLSSAGAYDFYLAQLAGGISSSDEQGANSALKVFPNPTRDWLQITGLESGAGTIQVFNSNGKLIKRISNPALSASISLGGLPPGTYQVEVRQGLFARKFSVVLIP